jgi:hypothetical protein
MQQKLFVFDSAWFLWVLDSEAREARHQGARRDGSPDKNARGHW